MRGHWHTAASCEALRLAEIDRTVAALGIIEALQRFEDAERVARRLAAEARARGHDATAGGLLAAADHLRVSQVRLTERYA